MRDKEFVYRGTKLEALSDFTNRIKRKYPDAKFSMSSDRPTSEALAGCKQYISITTVSRPTEEDQDEIPSLPVKKGEEKGVKKSSVVAAAAVSAAKAEKDKAAAEKEKALDKDKTGDEAEQKKDRVLAPVKKYRENSDLKVFYYAKGVQKSTEKRPGNEFKDLWVIKTYVFTTETFPTTRRRVEVSDRIEVQLVPVQNAVVSMKSKNKELLERIESVENAPIGSVDTGPLSMILNGVIDAAVQGGTTKYIEAFMASAEFEKTTQTDAVARKAVADLRQLLRDQIALLRRGMVVFGARADASLQGLFKHLSVHFETMVKTTASVVAVGASPTS